MLALTGVTVFPVTVAGTPGTMVPYAVVRPYSNVTAVDAPPAFTVPFNTADEEVSDVAAVVTTDGNVGAVANVISSPFVVPFALAPRTL